MNVPFFIARRYLFSKKSKKAINIISWISVSSIAIASFALVTVLSAFNGLQALVESMYEGFEPNVLVTPASGKWLELNESELGIIKSTQDVTHVSKVLETLTLVRYGEQQTPCTMKGVENNFIAASNLDSSIIRGQASLTIGDLPGAIVGYGLASKLSVYLNNAVDNLKLYAPKLKGNINMDPRQAFYTKSISPSGIYLVNPDIDNKYLIVPIDFARSLMQKKEAYTSIEIKTKKGMDELVKAELAQKLGSNYNVQSRFDLNPLIYKTNKTEKIVTFFILAFILIVSTFNVISTLTMIMLEKKKDISTLNILGINKKNIRKIFIAEGLLINAVGATIGLASGTILCLLQQEFGLLRLEGGIVEYYPVKLLITDYYLIIITVLIVGFFAAYFPSKILIKENSKEMANSSH